MSFSRMFVYVLLEFRNVVLSSVQYIAQNCQYFQEINIVNSLEIFTANIQMLWHNALLYVVLIKEARVLKMLGIFLNMKYCACYTEQLQNDKLLLFELICKISCKSRISNEILQVFTVIAREITKCTSILSTENICLRYQVK